MSKPGIPVGHEGIEESQKKVRKALADLMSGKGLEECGGEGVGGWSLVEEVEAVQLMDVGMIPGANGVFSYELSILDEDRFFETHATPDSPWDYMYLTVAVYCLVVFAKPLETIKLLHKCEECQGYYIAESKRKQRFCSEKCHNDWHNRKRIESGKAREYKRKRRAEGLDQ
jgi:hypothetical protein